MADRECGLDIFLRHFRGGVEAVDGEESPIDGATVAEAFAVDEDGMQFSFLAYFDGTEAEPLATGICDSVVFYEGDFTVIQVGLSDIPQFCLRDGEGEGDGLFAGFDFGR